MREDKSTREDDTMLDKFVGKKVRDKRLKLKMTLSAIANQLGVSHQQIQKYEQGQTRISAGMLFKLSKIFGVNSNYFFEGFKADDVKLDLSGTISSDRPNRVMNIFAIEDDPADELLMRKAIEESNLDVNLFTAHDGETALNILKKKTVDSFPRPDIILLDLNVPKRDGHSVLKEIKRDRNLQDIPVIIITNSVSVNEMLSVYKNHAAGYLCKSFDFGQFSSNIEGLIHYWGSIVVLPQRAS